MAVLAFTVMASGYTLFVIHGLGAFKTITSHFDGECINIAEVPGTEALQFDQDQNTIYFISYNQWAVDEEVNSGKVYQLDISDATAIPTDITPPQLKDFHPHGLSLFQNDTATWLFTNNHRQDGTHTVEVFRVTKGQQLIHEDRVEHEHSVSPNGILAVGPRKFYLTNDGASRTKSSRSLDVFLRRKSGNVVYYDGKEAQIVADKLRFPNGIALSINGDELYVAETIAGKLNVYKRNVNNGSLKHIDSIEGRVGMDNIFVNGKGELWIAVQPNLMALSKHLKNPEKGSPSQIIKVKRSSNGYEMDEVYSDSGDGISGASTVLQQGKTLYIGSVSESKLLKCTCDHDL
ncbi:MAG: SMP-30/gluconolactonase/LRE family protein [Bacteroidota bacterium]